MYAIQFVLPRSIGRLAKDVRRPRLHPPAPLAYCEILIMTYEKVATPGRTQSVTPRKLLQNTIANGPKEKQKPIKC